MSGRPHRLLSFILLFTMAPASRLAAQDPAVPPHEVERGERVLGPFELAEGPVRVRLRTERLVPNSAFAYPETTTAVVFEDAAGTVLFERPLPNRVTPDGFDRSFAVRVPLRIDLYDIGTTATGPWSLRGEYLGDLYIGELAVPEVRRVPSDAVREVVLHGDPEGGATETVTVEPDSEITFRPAYGRVQLVPGRGGEMVMIEVAVEGLRVVVDGHEGWTDDYAGVGLPAAG